MFLTKTVSTFCIISFVINDIYCCSLLFPVLDLFPKKSMLYPCMNVENITKMENKHTYNYINMDEFEMSGFTCSHMR